MGGGGEGAEIVEVSDINLWILVTEKKKKLKVNSIYNCPAKDKSERVSWHWLALWAVRRAEHTMPCWKTETHMCTY